MKKNCTINQVPTFVQLLREVLKLEPFIGDIGIFFLLVLGIIYHQWDNMFRE